MMSNDVVAITRWALEAIDNLYSDPAIKRFDPDLERKIAGKNSLWQADHAGHRVRWLGSIQGQRGDWAISKGGSLYLRDQLAAGKIAVGLVVLWRRQGNYATAQSIVEVWPKIENADWYHGDGMFAWVNERFEPANLLAYPGSRYVIDPDAPM